MAFPPQVSASCSLEGATLAPDKLLGGCPRARYPDRRRCKTTEVPAKSRTNGKIPFVGASEPYAVSCGESRNGVARKVYGPRCAIAEEIRGALEEGNRVTSPGFTWVS